MYSPYEIWWRRQDHIHIFSLYFILPKKWWGAGDCKIYSFTSTISFFSHHVVSIYFISSLFLLSSQSSLSSHTYHSLFLFTYKPSSLFFYIYIHTYHPLSLSKHTYYHLHLHICIISTLSIHAYPSLSIYKHMYHLFLSLCLHIHSFHLSRIFSVLLWQPAEWDRWTGPSPLFKNFQVCATSLFCFSFTQYTSHSILPLWYITVLLCFVTLSFYSSVPPPPHTHTHTHSPPFFFYPLLFILFSTSFSRYSFFVEFSNLIFVTSLSDNFFLHSFDLLHYLFILNVVLSSFTTVCYLPFTFVPY